jgi:hypothetical protein
MYEFIADSVSLRSDIDPANGFVEYEVVMSGVFADDKTTYVPDEQFRYCGTNADKALALFQTLTDCLKDDEGTFGGYGFVARRSDNGDRYGEWVAVLD